jgi:thioredoxin-related protein
MKTRGSIFILLLILCAGLLAFINGAPPEEIPINSQVPMPNYKMKDITGKQVSLAEIKKEKGLLVIFSCNTCPYVKLSESRIKEYTDYCQNNNIGSVLINSNEAQRGDEDSFQAMVKYYNEQQLRCCYTVDERSQLANAFGASRTPQCFLFDAAGALIYKGAIDDNVKDPSAVKAAYLREALSALIKNEKPKTQETKSIGCTIKRAES